MTNSGYGSFQKGSKRCKDYNGPECQLWCERLKKGTCPYIRKNADKGMAKE